MGIDIHFHLPDLLGAQLVAAHEAGYYNSAEELLAEAVRTFLAARPDIRVAAACRLYERGDVSLEKASELAGLNHLAMKQALHERGISRSAPESLTETEKMASDALIRSRRTE